MGDLCKLSNTGYGTRSEAPRGVFLTPIEYIRIQMNRAHSVQNHRDFYFSNLLTTSASRTPSALASLAHVKIVGIRLWFSIKLMAGRDKPVLSATVSCESFCSLRNLVNSLTTFSINSSEVLSLMESHDRRLANPFKRNYSYL